MYNLSKCLIKLLSLILLLGITESYKLLEKEHPKMILVSFDGFRWDYLKKFNLPHFNYLKSIGSHAEHIKNSFATVTFPNHWTIVTGMYEETHGIVQNSMYDRKLNKEFSTKNDSTQTYEWYGQNNATEPIWIANQKAGKGRKSAAEWVGAGVSFDDESAIFIPYNNTKPYRKLINQFIELFTRDDEPINFGAIYFDEPDHTGHLYGPYSKQMKEKLQYVDATLGYFLNQLKKNNLFQETNLIVTSDHGMEEISEKTAIFLDNHIDTNLFDAFGSRACYSLFVKNETNIDYVYKTLKTIENISVLTKHEVPKHYHYKKNIRIGDIVIITKLGWGVYIEKHAINWTINNGDHGFSNEESSMHPIFISHGPAFKKNFTIKPFNNVDIYPLMCLVLGITPGVNNGTLSNVIDMVNESFIPSRPLGFYFIILVVLPLSVFMLTVIFVFVRRKFSESNKNYEHLENTITEENSEEIY